MSKITLFADAHYRGKCVALTSECEFLGNLGMKDCVSSIKVEGGTWIVYQDANFKGVSHTLKPGNYPIWNDWGGANDQISSVRLKAKITLFADANYRGKSVELTSSCACLANVGMNNCVSSVKVEEGTWLAFQAKDYLGEYNTLKPGNYPIWNDWNGKNDTMSSIYLYYPA